MNLWVKDPKNKKRSVTLTLLVVGFVVCIVKLALADLNICGMQFGPFSGSDFAMAVGAVGAIYWGRKFSDKDSEDPVTEDKPPVEGPGA